MRPLHAFALSAALLLVAWAPILLLADDDLSALSDAQRSGVRTSLRGDADVRFALARPLALDPARESVVLRALEVAYSPDEADALRAYIQHGGRVLLLDDSPIAQQLLDDLDVGIALSTVNAFTPAFVERPERPLVYSTGVLPLPASLTLVDPVILQGGEPLLQTWPLAWRDNNANGRPDLDEPLGEQTVAARAAYGSGLIIVVGDPTVMDLQPEVARVLVDVLEEGGRTLVHDEAHRRQSDPLGAYKLLAGRPGPLSGALIVLLVVSIAIIMVTAPKLRSRDRATRRLGSLDADPRIVQQVLGELEPQ